MDETPLASPPTQRNDIPPYSRRVIAAVVIVGVLMFGVFGYLGYRSWKGHRAVPPAVRTTHLVLVPSATPFTSVQEVDLKTDALLAAPMLPGNPSLKVIDLVTGSTSTAYLASDATYTSSTLYVQEGSTEVAKPRTISNTFKYELSYDEVSGSAAYVVGSSTAARVVFYSGATQKEYELGAGDLPFVFPGGLFVLVHRGTSLISINMVTHKETTILSLEKGAVFAIDPSSLTLVLFNPTVQTFQYFLIASQTNATFSKTASTHMTNPASLAFLDGALIAGMPAGSTESSSTDVYIVSAPGAADFSKARTIRAGSLGSGLLLKTYER